MHPFFSTAKYEVCSLVEVQALQTKLQGTVCITE